MKEYIVITPSNLKKKVIELSRKKYYNYNIKFMSINEFIDKYTFSYDNKTIYNIMNKYNINLSSTLVYLNNLCYISDKLNNSKMILLKDIKKYLEDNNLLIYDNRFREYVKDKEIHIYGYNYINKYYLNIFKDLNYIVHNIEYNNYDIDKIYEFNYIDDEVIFVIDKIYELLRNNISIDKIKLIISNEYREVIYRLFKIYNIPINIKKRSIYSIKVVKDILNNLDDLDNSINNISILSKSSTGKTIQATLIKESSKDNIINDGAKSDFFMEDDVKEIIKVLKNENKSMVNENKSELNINKEVLRESILKHTGKEVRLNDAEAKLLEVIINKDEIKDKEINFIKNLFNSVESKQKGEEKELKSNDIRENIFNISKDLSKNITEKSEGAKEVIRNIISNLKESDENSTQILNIMKNSINDLKLFNKINDQYYCLDVPINFKENEYPCKLIIKDDRKEGKSIDSSNFKVAISVKTVKLGTVDALLNVKNRNIDLQLKCDKSVMNLFVISKEKLKEIVESSGFSTKIEIVERTEELQLSSCREFFNDNNIAAVDITV